MATNTNPIGNFSYGGLIRRGTRPGACGEATGRWRQIPRLAPACGRDLGTPSPPLLLVLRRPRWVWTLEAFARGPFLFRIVARPAFFFSRDERILGLLAHIEMGQRDGPSGRLVVVAHGLTYAFGHYCAQWTQYQPVCCLI